MRRLPLIVLFALSPLAAHAEGRIENITRYYSDGETQVLSPHLKAGTNLANDAIEVGAGYTADVVTSDSCDVRSWASQGRISDTRQEYTVDVNVTTQGGSIGANYIQSDENDYHSQTISLGTSKDFFDKNTTVSLGVSFGTDHVQSSSDKGFDQVIRSEILSLGLTQVLSKISLAQLLFEHRVESGYLSSPYRVARLLQSDGSVTALPENSPHLRGRNSLTFRYNYYWRPMLLAISNSVRFYMDNWGVKSVTVEENLSREINKKLTLGLDLRYYQQAQAEFYQDKYDSSSLPAYFTGNKTLSSFWTLLIGVRPTYDLSQGWELYGRVEYYVLNYFNFTDVHVPGNPNDDKLYSLTAQVYGLGITRRF